MPEKNHKCSVVVSSFDGNHDVWKPFFTLFFKYWPDCPFHIYLISNTIKYPDSKVYTITVGEDKKWATNLKTAFGFIDTPYILYLQEDYFLQKQVNTKYILSLLDYMEENKTSYLRVVPRPGPDIKFENNLNLGIISRTAQYRTSLQAAIWEKDFFNSMLVDGESGWDMEFKGTERSRESDRSFLSVRRSAFDYLPTTAIKKGKWYYDAVRFCQEEGIEVDLVRRPVESRAEFYRRKIKDTVRPFKNLARKVFVK